MQEDRPEEMTALEKEALQTLEHPEKSEPLYADMLPALRLWVYPSFTPYLTWLIMQPRKGKTEENVIVRKMVWERHHDMGRFGNPLEWLKSGYMAPPTIQWEDRIISGQLLDPLLADISKAPLSLKAEENKFVHLDGESRGIQNYRSEVRMRVEWHDSGPQERQAFLMSVNRLQRYLDDLFTDSDLPVWII